MNENDNREDEDEEWMGEWERNGSDKLFVSSMFVSVAGIKQ